MLNYLKSKLEKFQHVKIMRFGFLLIAVSFTLGYMLLYPKSCGKEEGINDKNYALNFAIMYWESAAKKNYDVSNKEIMKKLIRTYRTNEFVFSNFEVKSKKVFGRLIWTVLFSGRYDNTPFLFITEFDVCGNMTEETNFVLFK